MSARPRWLKPPVLLLVTLLLLAGIMPAFGQEPDNPVATLDPVQGLVQYRPADAPETDWRTINRAELVEEGDWVRTDNLGLAYLTFFEGVETEILPNTQLKIGKFQVDELQETFQITVESSVGDLHTQVEQVLDAGSSYELITPTAIIAVRGTDWWTSGNWLSETLVNTLDGLVEVAGISPEKILSDPVQVGPDQSVFVPPIGLPNPVGPLQELPQYPPSSPLAPLTCGNAVCDPGEENACPVDCATFPSCGDGVCQLELLEGPVTCAVDCVPPLRLTTDETAAELPSVPCTVITDRRNVALRVGPGYNRGIRDYLAANAIYPVLGTAQAPDNSLWWKLDIAGVPEAWVDQADVLASGDCASVPEAAPPPVVAPVGPVVVPQATAVPGQPTPTFAPERIEFYADQYSISPRECVTITWDVEGIREVYYEGEGVTGYGQRTECPQTFPTTYTLMVITVDYKTVYRTVTISIN